MEYLTRFNVLIKKKKLNEALTDAFNVSLRGMCIAEAYFGQPSAIDTFKRLTDDFFTPPASTEKLVAHALKLVTFDAWYRNPVRAVPNAHEKLNPDSATIENVIMMVRRSLAFFNGRGGLTVCGFDFAPNGYTETVHAVDGDFLTADTLWDMKVYRPSTRIASKQTLQILMYWIMGQHSGQEVFKGITKIGFYNPRQNVAYTLDVGKIPASVIKEIEDTVICY